ncbi:sensor histidine kinase [Jiangella rhizosphaerae]|uniref:sensor histidine kinase n=1 Tax=Jiangella rhizosphaerae TaxID=2293569 RepID=UPI0018F52AC2|nr:histidine kinase [Jiangella rhizosphaerae]
MAWRRTAGLCLGAVTAIVSAGFLLLIGLALLPVAVLPGARDRVLTAASRPANVLVTWERKRLRDWLATPVPHAPGRPLAYLAARTVVGLLGASILLLVVWGLVTVAVTVRMWLLGWPLDAEQEPVTGLTILTLIVPGAVLLYLAVQGLAGVVGLERRTARTFLGPTENQVLRRRIDELAESRAGVVAAVDAERRRIERDLHDGVQQRLVALGLLLGRARRAADRDRAAADDLLRAAHEESQRVLADLRAVAWRVYPAALDTLGLEEALTAVAEGAGAKLSYAAGEPPEPVATAVYFVVAEAVTNAVKHASPTARSQAAGESRNGKGEQHAGASSVHIDVWRAGAAVRVRVTDDGAGGADPAGGGLAGLRRRVAALDGRFAVESPPGRGTVVEAELPCD